MGFTSNCLILLKLGVRESLGLWRELQIPDIKSLINLADCTQEGQNRMTDVLKESPGHIERKCILQKRINEEKAQISKAHVGKASNPGFLCSYNTLAI